MNEIQRSTNTSLLTAFTLVATYKMGITSAGALMDAFPG